MKFKLIIILFFLNFNIYLQSMLILQDEPFLSDKVCQAIEKKDKNAIKELLENPKNFCGINEETQDTALIMAIKSESLEIVRLLLNYEFIRKTINDFGKNYTTALFWAKIMKDRELINILKEFGAIDEIGIEAELCVIL